MVNGADPVAAARRMWMDAVNRGALENYVNRVSENVVWLPPAGEPIVGRDAFRAWLEPFFERFDYRFSVEPIHMSWRRPSLLIAACFAASCAEAPPSAADWPGEVDTLNSGVVVVRNPEPDHWVPPAPWTLEEDLRIGSVGSSGPEEFADIRDVTVDERGFLYVSHLLPAEIRVFDTDGGFVRRIGREGEGPGELQRPWKLEWGPQGNLWVADGANSRFEVFDTAGAYVDSHQYVPGMYGYGDRWGEDGLLYTNMARRGFPFHLFIVRRRLVDGDLVRVDSVPAFGFEQGEAVPVTFERDGRRFTAMAPVPFQSRRIAFLDAGRGWWLSDRGSAYRVARLDPEGDTVMVVEQPYAPVPVSDGDVEQAMSRLGSASQSLRDRLPAVHPPVEELIGGSDGSLLVRRQGPQGPVLDVFSPEGVYQGAVPWPGLERLTIHLATDSVLYGVARNEVDAQFVVRLRIQR